MNRFGFYEIKNKSRDENYTVQSGDTLYKIAQEYGVDLQDLIDANDLADTEIYPGQVIVIPVKVSSGAMYFEEYVVEPNDTLEIVGRKLSIDPSVISQYNDITRLKLMGNQKLSIPKNYKTYTIVDGDTLEKILKKTGMSLEALVKANMSEWLSTGKVIYVK